MLKNGELQKVFKRHLRSSLFVFVKRIILDTIEGIEIDSGPFVTAFCFGFLPMMIEGIGFFYVLKRIVVKIKLTNEKLVYGIQDDTDNSMYLN